MCLNSLLMPYLTGWFYHALFLGAETWLAPLRTVISFDLNNIHPSLLFLKALISCSKASKWINFLIFHSGRLGLDLSEVRMIVNMLFGW